MQEFDNIILHNQYNNARWFNRSRADI